MRSLWINKLYFCHCMDKICSLLIRTIVGPPPPPLIVPLDPDEEEFWVPIDLGCLIVAPSPLSSDGETDALLLSSWCLDFPPMDSDPPPWVDPDASSRRKLLTEALISSIWVSVKSRSFGTVPLILWRQVLIINSCLTKQGCAVNLFIPMEWVLTRKL